MPSSSMLVEGRASWARSARAPVTAALIVGLRLGLFGSAPAMLLAQPVAQEDARKAALQAFHEAEQLRAAETAQALPAALAKYTEALQLWRRLGDRTQEATTLASIGHTYIRLSQHERATVYFEQALSIYRDLRQRSGETDALDNLASSYTSLAQNAKAVEYLEQLVAIWRERRDGNAEATALDRLGSAYQSLGERDKAVSSFQAAAALWRAMRDGAKEANSLFDLGLIYSDAHEYPRAIGSFERTVAILHDLKNPDESALICLLGLTHTKMGELDKGVTYVKQGLALSRQLRNVQNEATCLTVLSQAYFDAKRYEQAIPYYEDVLSRARAQIDRPQEASNLTSLGLCYSPLHQYRKAIDYFEQALTIERELKHRKNELNLLLLLAAAHDDLNQYETAIGYVEDALAIGRETKDRAKEALALGNLGVVYDDMDEPEKSIAYCERAAAMQRELKDSVQEARALRCLGFAHGHLSQNEKALGYFERALSILPEPKDRALQADLLNSLGFVYVSLSQYEKSLRYGDQALALSRESQDRRGESTALNVLSRTYDRLNQTEKAIGLVEQRLALEREGKNRIGEAFALNSLGVMHGRLAHRKEESQFYEEALKIFREVRSRRGEAVTLGNIGKTHYAQGQYTEALRYAEEALAIAREVKSPEAESYALDNLGWAYNRLGRYEKAVDYHEQALTLVRQMNAPDSEAWLLSALMSDWKLSGKSHAAIFYGEQAVKALAEVRGGIRGLAKELRESYVQDREETYRTLADLFTAEERFADAQQVLNQLKDDEFGAFVHRDAGFAAAKAAISLTSKEAAWEQRYRVIADRVATIGSQRGALLSKFSRTAEEEKELNRLDADLAVAGEAFQGFLDTLTKEFQDAHEADEKVFQLRESQALKDTLRTLGPGTVAIYTLVGEKTYRSILTTPDVQKGYQYPIAATDLRRKIADFRTAVQDPRVDPRPLAQELYRILVAPMASDLAQANAQTLMWSLDGELRYLPLAALYDGEKYLVERYRNAVFTPASQTRLKDAPSDNWRVLGLGVSKSHQGFSSLPNVPIELRAVIREGSGSGGVFDGSIKLDEGFTRESMQTALREGYSVVHIASHFNFQPGSDVDSFLVLGDGGRLTLDEFRSLPQVFENVDLLTLSACNTAVGAKGDGREVEGFGVLAQRQGAKAVIATLWPVADKSTALLMEQFYRIHAANPGIAKADALRQAQLVLLRGEAGAATLSPVRGMKPSIPGGASPAGSRAPYAHPYYWAPFILIGNWK